MLSEADGTRLLELLDDLDIEVVGEPPNRRLATLAQVARPHQLTAYDAAYLDLAVGLGLPLFTDDKNLREAAARSGVELVWKM